MRPPKNTYISSDPLGEHEERRGTWIIHAKMKLIGCPARPKRNEVANRGDRPRSLCCGRVALGHDGAQATNASSTVVVHHNAARKTRTTVQFARDGKVGLPWLLSCSELNSSTMSEFNISSIRPSALATVVPFITRWS